MADYRVIVIGPDGSYIEAKAPDRVVIDNLLTDAPVLPSGDPTGFVSVGETDLTWDHGTATLTISPTGPSFSFYVGGTKFTKDAPESVTISLPGHAYYSFAYDANGDLVQCATPFLFDGNFCPVAVVTYDTTAGTRSFMADHRGEHKNALMARKLGHFGENVRVTRGFDIGDYTLDVDNDLAIQFSLTSGAFTLLDIVHNVADIDPPTASYEQALSKPAQLAIVYRIGADWTWDAPGPFFCRGGVGSGRTVYNLDTAGTWSLAEPPDDSYIPYWIILTNNTTSPIISVMGQTYYSDLATAKSEATIDKLWLWERFPATCYKVLYRVMVQTGNGYGGNRKAKIQDVADYRGAYRDEHLTLQQNRQSFPADHAALKNTTAAASHPAGSVAVGTSNFQMLLGPSDTDVQTALEALDLHHHHAEPVVCEHINLYGENIHTVAADFFSPTGCPYFRNHNMGSWEDLYQHCYWQIQSDSMTAWTTPPQKFNSTGDFFAWMQANVQSNPSEEYTENAKIQAFEIVDDRDPFPIKLHHRNSLLASMMGRKMWLRKRTPGYSKLYGVATGFYNWYPSWANTLGLRLVNYHTSVVPPINNDDVVWYSRGTRTLWNWPKSTTSIPADMGHSVYVTPGARGAAWDVTSTAWVAPAPAGYYNIRDPFLLVEWNRGRGLSFEPLNNSRERNASIQSVCCLVYPLEYQDPAPGGHLYLSFLMVPHGCDNFMTEYVDPLTHEVSLCKYYAHGFNKNYLKPYAYHWSTATFESGWGFFRSDGTYSQSLIFAPKTTPGGQHFTADPNSLPKELFIAKRNLVTGIRSPWRSVVKIRKRVPHATYRVEPSPRWHRI
jgi:hypothetical protein